MSSDTSVLYFALMGIIYGGVYIGQVSLNSVGNDGQLKERHNRAYQHNS